MAEQLAGGSSRHIGVEGVKRYVEAAVPATLRVDGSPIGYLVIDPAGKRLAVQVPEDGAVPDCSRYENVATARLHRAGMSWNELSIAAGDRLQDMYPLLCQVLDRVQLEGQSFGNAVLEVLRAYRDVLSARTGMAESDQIGLYGELLVVEHLIQRIGPETALRRWLGPADEEHDFAFPAFDLEVKTTSAERRRHWISSPTQLTRTANKALYLVSIQITGASDEGRTLAQVVTDIDRRLSDGSSSFMAKLEEAGFHAVDADLYTQGWTLRSRPAAFCVDETFPVVDLEGLAGTISEVSRIVAVRYQVDVEGLHQSTLEELHDFTEA